MPFSPGHPACITSSLPSFSLEKCFSPIVTGLRGMMNSDACPYVQEARGISVSPSSNSCCYHFTHCKGKTINSEEPPFLIFFRLRFSVLSLDLGAFLDFSNKHPMLHLARAQLLLLEIEGSSASNYG